MIVRLKGNAAPTRTEKTTRRFNSMIVRLKDLADVKDYMANTGFQFYDSPIKRKTKRGV